MSMSEVDGTCSILTGRGCGYAINNARTPYTMKYPSMMLKKISTSVPTLSRSGFSISVCVLFYNSCYSRIVIGAVCDEKLPNQWRYALAGRNRT